MGEKSYEKILIHDALNKNLIDAKPLSIMFNKVDGLLRDYGETKHLVLFDPKKYDSNYDRIR